MPTVNLNLNLPDVGGDANVWGPLLNQNFNLLDQILGNEEGAVNINIDNYTVDGMTLTNVAQLAVVGPITEGTESVASSGTINISGDNGTVKTISMAGDVTIQDGLSDGATITLLVSSVGANTITWPSGIKWMFGAAPVLDQAEDNIIVLFKIAGTLYGSYAGSAS